MVSVRFIPHEDRKRITSRLVVLAFLLFGGLTTHALAQKEVLASFCQFPLTEDQRQAHFTFTQMYRVKIDKEGQIIDVLRISGKEEWVSITRAKACMANWKFRGFEEGKTFLVDFSWEHGIGWTHLGIAGSGFRQHIYSGDAPCSKKE